MNIITYFHHALEAKLNPTLLQFTHPIKKTPLHICGIDPSLTLLVRDGMLYQDNQAIGGALEIFDHLNLPKTTEFFPAFLGFFGYEFARHLGQVGKRGGQFPDALFRLYKRGVVIDDGKIIHHDPITVASSKEIPLSPLFQRGDCGADIDEARFCSVVENIKERIKRGDVYQVNFSVPFSFKADDDAMLPIYQAMRTHNQSPFMGILQHQDFFILSGSPERLFSLNNGHITTRPIAGTKKRGATPKIDNEHLKELTTCPKENAEHVMLVDLLRNDLNQIATPGSVRIDEDRSVEFYSHVMHLVSEISGETQKNLQEIMHAMFPGGTITGAPKAHVMKAIFDLESLPRGPYTGSLGYISSGYGMDFNILIRSVFKAYDQAWINAGAGIVIDSVAQKEWAEINNKAQAVKDVLAGVVEAKPGRGVIKGPPLLLLKFNAVQSDKHVLFIENHDSFSFNIIDAVRSLKATVDIASHGVEFKNYTHIIIGPGPGNPQDMPELSSLIDTAVQIGLPLLGICLGHQALAYHFGAAIKRAPQPIHGQSQPIHHVNKGLFVGLSSPSLFTRYHSLVIDRAPTGFVVDAYSDDDCIMAISHQSLPLFGLQFHPESYLSSHGSALLHQFLRAQPCPH
jgi:anthranilate synthase